jgi:dTDP-4-amino-4,6-dideoxygalactose transaminase
MDFIDLAAQQRRIRQTLETRILKVLDHGKYIMGPEIRELENRLSVFTGVSHAISCASGTDALLMALMAFDVGPGQVVFTTPFTFIATAEVIRLLGATPVFVDIDSQSYNLSADHLDRAISSLKNRDTAYPLPKEAREPPLKPAGIIAVDLFGLPADYDQITAVARKHGLFVIEDAAQSFGAEYKSRKSCALAEIACTSFFPAKPLGCYGDGGAIFTDNPDLADKIRSIRVHGQGTHKYDNARIGINGRMDTLQAAILLAKLDIFPEEINLRRQAAEVYTRLLAEKSGIVLPIIPSGYRSAWAQYSILAQDEPDRTRRMDQLQKAGVPTAVYYPKPLHLQTAFSNLGYAAGDFPVSEGCAGRIFSLPMHPYLTPDDQLRIAGAL